MARVINCQEGHALVRISGNDEDELVQNAREHLRQHHPGLGDLSREQILAMATIE